METYKCKFCGKEFNSKAGTTRHEKYCKQNPNAVPCKTGHESWNKGKTAQDDPRIAKASENLKKYYETHDGAWLNKKHSEETKQLLAQKRHEYLLNNPDKHVWKRNTKFKSAPCEELKNKFRSLGISFIEEYCPFTDSAISLDIAFPDIKVGIEVNGNQHYNNDGSLKDYYQKRHDKLEEAGWTIYEIHYTLCYNIKNFDDIRKLDIYNKDYVGKYFSQKELRKQANIEKEKQKQLRQIEKQKVREELTAQRKFIVLNSNIDYTKFGWVGQLAKKLNMSHTCTRRWLLQYMPEFYETCYVRSR